MKLYYFPSPNPQKVRFALLELGLACEIVSVDLTKREHRKPGFLALNPNGRVPVLTDGKVTLWESHAILDYLGDMTGKMWPTSAPGRADALR
jgi:glutathione S-transferase